MEQAFKNLVAVLWRLCNAGQLACSVILLVDRAVARVSLVGVLSTQADSLARFLDSVAIRANESFPPIRFSDELSSAVSDLIGTIEGKRYALCIIHPLESVQDIIIANGNMISEIGGEGVSGSGYVAVVLSSGLKPRKGLKYVVPGCHQLKKTA